MSKIIKPKILVMGYARHGKDTVAEILRDEHGYRLVSTSMFLAEHVTSPVLATEHGITYASVEDCYNDRVNHRSLWYDIIKAWNAKDPIRLSREILTSSDICIGIRSSFEYKGCVEAGIYDYIWWVDASGRGLPPEDRSSMDIDFEPETMTLIDNSGTLDDLRAKIAELVSNKY